MAFHPVNMAAASAPSPGSRREFISTLAAAAAATPAVLGGIARAANAAPAASPAPRDNARPSCLHVFSKPLQWLSYEETARIVAEAGYGGIDFSVRPGGHVLPERVHDDLPRAIAAAHASGLKVEMITTGILNAADKDTVRVLETAARLGVKYYRLGWFSYDFNAGVWATLNRLKPLMRDLAQLNQSLGLHGAYQNHSGIRVGGSSWDVHELIRELDPRWIGCQFDIRHATVEGGQSWAVALRLLHPWIRCIDIKDFRWNQAPGKATAETVALGDGVVNYPEYFRLVRELGIGGPMSVHFEYPPLEGGNEKLSPADRRARSLEAMKRDNATLKRLLHTAQLPVERRPDSL